MPAYGQWDGRGACGQILCLYIFGGEVWTCAYKSICLQKRDACGPVLGATVSQSTDKREKGPTQRERCAYKSICLQVGPDRSARTPMHVPELSAAVESAQELLWPTRCVACDHPGELLCEECRGTLPWIDQRWACPACGAPFGTLTCTECKGDWLVRSCVCALPLKGVGARLATCLKDAHELRLAPVVAAAIACALDEAAAWPANDGRPRFDRVALDALCFVPATRAAYRRRGFDHMELVTRELSWLLSLPVADALVREEGRDQRTLGRRERARNLEGTVEVVQDVGGLHLLLADDVVTTGASVGACTQALLEAGAADVTVCALARVW